MAEDASNIKGELPDGASIRRVDVPVHYASSIQGGLAGNDFTFVFSRTHPILIENGNNPDAKPAGGAAIEPVVAVTVSPQTAKDLLVLAGDMVKRYEAEFGEIETEFTRSRKKKT